MTDRKNGTNTGGRKTDGKFAKGNPGKPPGARHKITRAVEDLLNGQAEAVSQAAIDKALEGDTTAMRIVLERVAPALKDKPVSFDLPPIETAGDAAQAASAVLAAVAAGDLTPTEGASVMGLVDSYRRTLEASDFEERLTKLEDAK